MPREGSESTIPATGQLGQLQAAMGSQRGVESPMSQGDRDAIHGIDFVFWGFSGPQTLPSALASLSTMEPHVVGLLCACSIYHLTGEAGRAVDFPGLRLLTSSSLIALVSKGRPGLQVPAWTPTPFPSLSSELSSSRSADHQHSPPFLYTAASGNTPHSPAHIAIIKDPGLFL